MDTKKDLQKIFQNTLMEFWDKSLEPTLSKILGRFDGAESRLDGVGERLGKVDGRLNKVEEKVISINQRTRSMDTQLETIEKTLAKKADTELINDILPALKSGVSSKGG